VRDFGATGDGKTLETRAVQRALDAAGRRAATLRFGPGTFRCGTLRLRSGVGLVLETGATLLATDRLTDFLPTEQFRYSTDADVETSDFHRALLTGEALEHVAILGEGTIDGGRTQRGGPKPIALRRCRNVTVRGVTIRNAPNYCVSLGGCDDVLVEGVTIRDAFADGIDPDCCRRVRIIGCDVESDDDAIVLKASLILGVPRPTEDVTVERCRMVSPSNGFKIGTETHGPVRRVNVRDCQIVGHARPNAHLLGTGGPGTTSAEGGGVAIESVDGGTVEKVNVERTVVTDASVPVFVRLGRRAGDRPGAVRDVTVRALTATGAREACTVSGVPGLPVDRLTIDGVTLTVAGRTTSAVSRVPEFPAAYPKAGMFGTLPASGVWVRHARAVQLLDVHVTVTGSDARPLLLTDDVTGLVVQPPL
jgi:polygalacturonase